MPPRPSPKTSSSQVSWALLTEGVTEARVEMHRLRALLKRALTEAENSPHKEEIYRAVGDVILGAPDRLEAAETALDRTAYALSVMGKDFLKSRLPLSERVRVEEAEVTAPYSEAKRPKMARRVALQYLSAKGSSAEHMFHDNPQKREVREFAQTGALSNDAQVAPAAVREMDNPDRTPARARSEANKAPPTPSENREGPGGSDFSTLNRFVVKTMQPDSRGLPQNRDQLPRAEKPRGGLL